jgi:hypothetical protein
MEIKNDLYQCTKCLIFQSKDFFHKKNNKLGIRSVCKTCRGIERTKVYAENKKAITNILLEIKKCDVVCANCHRIRTFVKAD